MESARRAAAWRSPSRRLALAGLDAEAFREAFEDILEAAIVWRRQIEDAVDRA